MSDFRAKIRRRRWKFGSWVPAGLVLAAVTVVSGFPPPKSPPRESGHTEREEVRLVLLPVSVTDRRGIAKPGLQARDFVLHEDGVLQTVRYLNAEATEPISLAFLLDLSGSMRQVGKLDRAKWAVEGILDELEPVDRAGLICFADRQVSWVTDFTTDRDLFRRRLDVQEGYGKTALYDALAGAPGLVDAEHRGRRAIVLLTDGFDNSSTLNMYEATRTARRTGVPIYIVGFATAVEKVRPAGSKGKGWRALEMFSRETGGRMFQIHDTKDLKRAMDRIDVELKLQYLLGYYPTDRDWSGRFRRIRLEADRRGLTVRTRSGYYAVP